MLLEKEIIVNIPEEKYLQIVGEIKGENELIEPINYDEIKKAKYPEPIKYSDISKKKKIFRKIKRQIISFIGVLICLVSFFSILMMAENKRQNEFNIFIQEITDNYIWKMKKLDEYGVGIDTYINKYVDESIRKEYPSSIIRYAIMNYNDIDYDDIQYNSYILFPVEIK